MAKKIIRLTEADLRGIVRRCVNEAASLGVEFQDSDMEAETDSALDEIEDLSNLIIYMKSNGYPQEEIEKRKARIRELRKIISNNTGYSRALSGLDGSFRTRLPR